MKNPVPLRFELLTARHNEKVASFDCGNSTITQWLRQDALREMIAGVHLTSTDKALHLYTGELLQFDPHPAANSRADYYKSMQAIRLLIRGEQVS
jgi:hypothetical protein